VDGAIGTATPPSPALPVSLKVGGITADSVTPVASPGLSPGVVAFQARVPASAPSGSAVAIVVTVGTIASQLSATMAVQ
jgi:hypothetical protein